MRTHVTLAAAALLAVSTAHAAPSGAAGKWWGLIQMSGHTLRLTAELRDDGGGKWSGTLGSPDQSPAPIPLGSVHVDGDEVAFDYAPANMSYKGTRAGDRIKGTFTQKGFSLPMELRRGPAPPLADAVKIAGAKPQDPKPPFSYASEEVTVDGGAIKFACTLTHPHSAKYPAVVFISGSGPEDRDENIGGHKPFLILADALAKKGVGALRCDDRGVGGSTGSMKDATTYDFAADTAAQFAWLVARPDVEARHVGLIGHSEGGSVAPIVASKDKRVAFLVLLAGPGVPTAQLLVHQVGAMAKQSGATPTEVADNEALEKKVIDVVLQEKDDAAARKKITALVGPGADVNTLVTPWFRAFIAFDPKPILQKIKVPVLALNGARDFQVDAEENLAAMRAALAADKDVTVKSLPGLNHLFQECTRCTLDEYAELEQTMSPAVIDLVSAWVAQHAK
jgi:uncharacterized protein